MNQLDTYLRSRVQTAKALAMAAGVSQPYICDLRYNRRKPGDDVAKRIEAATNGAVKHTSWRAPAEADAS